MTFGIDVDVLELTQAKTKGESARPRGKSVMQDILCPLPYDHVSTKDFEAVQIVNAPSANNSILHSGIEVAKDARVEVAGQKDSKELDSILRSVANSKSLEQLSITGSNDPKAIYEDGCAAWAKGDAASAAQVFLTLSLLGHKTGSALYGLASSLCKSGQYKEALELSLVVGAAGQAHPRPMLLAGYAAYKLNNANLGRRCLARASRIARGKPEFTEELRFAQRLLLTQHFGD